MSFLRHPDESELKRCTLDEFEIQMMELIRKEAESERIKKEMAQKRREEYKNTIEE